jgi:hypothetical protein
MPALEVAETYHACQSAAAFAAEEVAATDVAAGSVLSA